MKHCHQDTHSEGWGRLHNNIGTAHYFQGNQEENPYPYWRDAVIEYKLALQTLTQDDFPEFHLEVLQNLIKAYLGLGQTAKAQELERRGTELLQRLLEDLKPSDKSQQKLALKFVGFKQLTVDIAVQSGEVVNALTLAEEGKNTCLTWLLYAWTDEISSPSHSQIQQLLNPTTAAIYWHISSYALHTFILKHNASEPILITTPTLDNQETLREPVKRQREFEDWVTQWNQKYQEYSAGKTPVKQQPDNILPWREALPEMLQNLANILNIPAILTEINHENPDTPIQNLILIPHRDLHRFPLHALFPDNFCITYLPSAQMGINILNKYQQRDSEAGKPEIENNTKIFSVEHPNSQGLKDLPFAEIESAAICQLFQNPTRIDSDRATKPIVETNLKDTHKIFSFTGHGGYNYRHPDKSLLYLSGDDQLTVAEICKLPLSHYYLVTLSACETAISGNHSITTEYVGLISGFMRAGVDHVVSTLWKVESEACALIMMKFYHLLRQTHFAPVALNQAKIWLRQASWGDIANFYQEILTNLPVNVGSLRLLIEDAVYRINTMEENNCPFTDPYYWAAFTITGLPNQPYREII